MSDNPLRDLPKAHLHVHLEGCMRPTTLEDLAAHYGMQLPPTRGFTDFPAFSAMYKAACTVIRTPDDLARLVREVVEDAADDGAVWVEPAFYAPYHAAAMGGVENVMEIVLEAGRSAAATTGIGVGFMVSCNRVADPADAVAQARMAVRYADRGVVSFGLANDEAIGAPEPFEEAFSIARRSGLLSTPHAGELAGPASITGALDALGADRIQHGVRAVEDPALMERLASEGICLDVCPTSNVLLKVCRSLEEHPLGTLLDAGIACSVNADDSLLFGPGLLDEYQLCRDALGFDDDRLAAVAGSSVLASGAPDDLKATALAGIEAWLRPAPQPAR